MTVVTAELIAHIEARNAETRAWVAAGPDRWAGEWTTDPAHWAECGVYTVADFNAMLDAEGEREERKAILWYGAAYGDEEAMAQHDAEMKIWLAEQEAQYEADRQAWYAEIEAERAAAEYMAPTKYEAAAIKAGWGDGWMDYYRE